MSSKTNRQSGKKPPTQGRGESPWPKRLLWIGGSALVVGLAQPFWSRSLYNQDWLTTEIPAYVGDSAAFVDSLEFAGSPSTYRAIPAPS